MAAGPERAALGKLLADGLARHRAGDLAAAETAYTRVLAQSPGHPDALNLLADVALRRGDHAAAGKLLDQALEHHPRHAGARFARGGLSLALNHPARAEKDLRAVVKLTPENAEAWSQLARALQAQDRLEQALAAARRAVRHAPQNPGMHNNLGLVLEALGRLEEAGEAYRAAIERDAGSPEAWNNLGNVLKGQGRLTEAEAAYLKALARGEQPLVRANLAATLHRQGRLAEAAEACRQALDARPESAEAWITLGAIENDREAPQEAERALRRALRLNPGNPEALNNLGLALQRMNRVDEAIAAWREALAGRPQYSPAQANLAGLLEKLGRLEEARAEALEVLERSPADPQANWVLAKCERRGGAPEQALERLDRLADAGLSLRWRQSIAFERGRLLDQLGKSAAAWAAFTAGNRAASQRWLAMNPGPNAYRRELDAVSECFNRDWVARWRPLAVPAADRADPVFLVGFPRSGTTLLDQVLNAHPGITVIEEGPMLAEVLTGLEGLPGGYPRALAELDGSQVARLRGIYFAAAERENDSIGQTTLVDKLPLNAARAALIHRLFPGARFIFAVRHPADVCLSCFMQEFGFNDAMANFHTLEDTVALYGRVMDLWRRATDLLALRVHRVSYEDLVADLESQARALIGWLDLEWDERVLDYAAEARKRGRINTPSYHQVTRPIYTEARGRWQRYREFLAPRLPALQSHAEWLGYSFDEATEG